MTRYAKMIDWGDLTEENLNAAVGFILILIIIDVNLFLVTVCDWLIWLVHPLNHHH